MNVNFEPIIRGLKSDIFSTARCSSSRNSLRGIHHPVPSNILLKSGAISSFDGISITMSYVRCFDDDGQ